MHLNTCSRDPTICRGVAAVCPCPKIEWTLSQARFALFLGVDAQRLLCGVYGYPLAGIQMFRADGG